MLRNYTNYRVITLLTPNFGEIGPRARFSGVPNSPTPKSYNHSEIRDFSDTVQGLRLVLVRNDQPFDLPCPYDEYRGSGVYGGYGGLAENGCLSPIFRAFYLNKIVPIPKHSSITSCEGSHELPTI